MREVRLKVIGDSPEQMKAHERLARAAKEILNPTLPEGLAAAVKEANRLQKNPGLVETIKALAGKRRAPTFGGSIVNDLKERVRQAQSANQNPFFEQFRQIQAEAKRLVN